MAGVKSFVLDEFREIGTDVLVVQHLAFTFPDRLRAKIGAHE